MKSVRLEDFVGQPVRDRDGRRIGHLHEVRARREGDELVVVDYLVGPAGWAERFSLAGFGRELAGLFGFGRSRGYVVPWDRMDLGASGEPRCTCAARELQRAG
ncbi:MAG TPA: PRC-barrel domain-containing protein [Burkholderiales bacterium]|nr:PRC-barrel domain-containing protein [Burkholderiales bacterium]